MLPSWPCSRPVAGASPESRIFVLLCRPCWPGSLGGSAHEGTQGHAFQLTWKGGHAPLEMASCQLVLTASRADPYRFELVTHQLVQWLMDCTVGEPEQGDLPDEFWVWLLVGTDQDGGDA